MVDALIRDGSVADEDALAALVPDPDLRFWRVRRSATGHERLIVAELGGRVVGAASVRWAGECDPPNPWLYGVKVLDLWRGRGIGSSLCDRALEVSRESGHETLSLDVDLDNVRARRLYENLGYEVVGPHLHHWVARDRAGRVSGGGEADTWLMRGGRA